MSRTDNHPVTQLLLVVVAIAAATVAAFLFAGKWAVLVPIVLIPAWRLSRRAAVSAQITSKGWSGRRFKDYWVYEEQQGKERPSLSIKLVRADDDHYLFPVPPDDVWRRTMPLWAAERRREIVDRILTAWPAEDVRWPAGEQP